MPEINFKVKNGLTVAGLAGNTNEIVILSSDGSLSASDVTIASISGGYTSADNVILSTVASISGNLQSQISAITVPTSATFLADYDARYVNTTGNESVSGIKTFTSPIISYSGTADTAVVIGKNAGSATIDTGHVVIGSGAGTSLITPYGGTPAVKTNVLIGRNAGSNITDGFDNVLIGDNVSVDIPGATDAVVIGADSNGTSSCVVIGSLNGTTAGNAVVVGYASGVSSSQGIAIGYATGIDPNSNNSIAIGCQNNISGASSVAIGYFSYTNGNNGIAIGSGAGSDFANSIAIGKDVYTTQAYQLMLGGSDITETVLRGNVKIPVAIVDSISGASGNIVTHDASGKLLDSGMSIPTSATFLTDYDNRYVNVTGDTMTGNLIITSDTSDPALQINSDGDARIRLNNPAGNETYGEIAFANSGTDRYGIYVGDNSTFGFYDYVAGKDRLNYYPLTNGWIFNSAYEGNVTPLIVRGYNDTLFSVIAGSTGYDGRIIMNPDAETGSVRIMNSSDDSAEISWATPVYVNGNVASGVDIFSIRGNITNETLSVYSYPLSANVVNIDVNTGDTTFGYDVTFDTLADITGANSLVAHDANGKIFSTGLEYTEVATKQEVYNLDVDLQGQIVNVLNPAEVANISGSAVTIDSFPHYSERGMAKWFIHLDDGSNQRASEVMVTFIPNSTIKFAEQSVESIGTTTDAVLSVTTDATNVYLKLTSSNLWNFKTKRINL